MEAVATMADNESHLNLKATELRLGLPGSTDQEETVSPVKSNKRASPAKSVVSAAAAGERETAPPPKAQIVGWPPVKSYRKNNIQANKTAAETSESGMFVKVSMDGAAYLRKVDLKIYGGYSELLGALETMFKLTIGEYSEREGYKGSEYAPAYEDKDGDLMLLGDVPWEMFMSTCKRLRIMRGADARGLGGAAL